jgi:hypothetical protein
MRNKEYNNNNKNESKNFLCDSYILPKRSHGDFHSRYDEKKITRWDLLLPHALS